MHDLFKLGDSTVGTETGNMFRGAEKIYGEGISSDTTAAAPEENDDDPMELRKIAGVAALENLYVSSDNYMYLHVVSYL